MSAGLQCSPWAVTTTSGSEPLSTRRVRAKAGKAARSNGRPAGAPLAPSAKRRSPVGNGDRPSTRLSCSTRLRYTIINRVAFTLSQHTSNSTSKGRTSPPPTNREKGSHRKLNPVTRCYFSSSSYGSLR